MAHPSTEADARILIDDLLKAAGWVPADKSQVRTEVPISEAFHVGTAVTMPEGSRTSDAGITGWPDKPNDGSIGHVPS